MERIIKLIPKATYSKKEGFDNKDFEKEIDLYKVLSDSEMNIPDLIDAGEGKIAFGNIIIDCYYIIMKYIAGDTLEKFKISKQLSAIRIAQIAYDLFDFLRLIESNNLNHNDLHDRNILIEISNGDTGRLGSIDRTTRAFIIDFGSVSDEPRSDQEHYRDITWIVWHIKNLIDSYWSPNLRSEDEYRILSRLNALVSTWPDRERTRAIRTEDYCTEIYHATRLADNPWAYPKELITVSDYYNTQLMPPYYAPNLFYDPEGRWAKDLMKPGPIVLTGMRGCGKTILLKSLHFFARAQAGPKEKREDVIKRLTEEKHVGLFVSCAALLTAPGSNELHLPNHKLILAFSEDLIKCLRYCELEFQDQANINFSEIGQLCVTLKGLIPWYVPPPNTHDLTSIEISIETALLGSNKVRKDEAGELNVYGAWNILAKRIQNSIEMWNNKHIIFLLDDVSARYLKQENVEEILSQLCFQAASFSFKISTETPTLRLKTGAGEFSRIDRDYEGFDLGNEVMQQLKIQDSSFIENVLKKRFELMPAYRGKSPTKLLGYQSFSSIARKLASEESGRRKGGYWGIRALGALSTGDIGDSILMFQRMLAQTVPEGGKISAKIQDSVILNFSEKKLRLLAQQDQWLYAHAISFAQASGVELRSSYADYQKNSKSRIRQYNEVFLRIDPEGAENIFEKIFKLVEAGVYIFEGGTPRSKTPEEKAPLFFKLAYRKILGVTNLMPISNRDRFELSGDNLRDWLDNPTPEKLRKTVGMKIIEDSSKEVIGIDWFDVEDESEIMTEGSLQAPQKNIEEFIALSKGGVKNPYTVKSFPLRDLRNEDIQNKFIICAMGFEDRSIGTWNNLLSIGKPSGAALIEYDDEGHKKDILKILGEQNLPYEIIPVDNILPKNPIDQEKDSLIEFIEKLPGGEITLDITSMSKPLIFLLTSEILKRRKRLGIIHTNAVDYWPSASDIERVLPLLEEDPVRFYQEADKLIEGELDPRSRMTIWQNRDPGSSVCLICFASLKYSRVKKLLDELQVDCLNIIFPLSSDGEESARSRFAKEIANTFAGDTDYVWPTGSNDHIGAFSKLVDLHNFYSLEHGINVEIGLTGVKMHSVAAGMLASIASLSGVYYTPVRFNPNRYTIGTGNTTFTELSLCKNSE